MIEKLLTTSSLSSAFSQLLLHPMRKLANTENGSCYLIGNGSSLKYFNLEHLGDKPSIGCNYQFIHRDSELLNLKYYLHLAPMSTLGSHAAGLRPLFAEYVSGRKQTQFFMSLRDRFRFSRANVCHVAPIGKNWPGNVDEQKRQIFSARNKPLEGSLRGQIALAIFLGFSKATLVGHDYLLKPTIGGHFYEKPHSDENPLDGVFENGKWNQDFLIHAQEFIDLEIISQSDYTSVLKTVTIQERFATLPSYRENDQIVDNKYLKILNSVSEEMGYGYRIFR